MSRLIAIVSLLLLAVVGSGSVHAQVSWSVQTIAGVPGLAGHDDGPPLQARFDKPTWLDVFAGPPVWFGASAGDIFVVDRVNQSVRQLNGFAVRTRRYERGWWDATPVAFDFGGPFGGGILVEPPRSGCGGGVYERGMFVASSGAHQIVLASFENYLANRDDIEPFIGAAGMAGWADGTNLEARFDSPTGLAKSWNYPSLDQRLYIADTGNQVIREVAFRLSFEGCPQHYFVRTLAGTPRSAGSLDGPAAAARFRDPRGVAAGPDGSVYVADSGNHTLRRILPGGEVVTIAGKAGEPGHADGPASEARLDTPSGIDVAADGTLYVADTGNHVIRMLTPDGVLTTIAGTPRSPGFADGTGAAVRFNGPVGLRLAPDGTLVVADTSNHVIRRLSATPPRQRPIRGTDD